MPLIFTIGSRPGMLTCPSHGQFAQLIITEGIMPFPWKKGGDRSNESVDDLEPELQAKPTMASMQAEYSMQHSDLNESSLQYSEEVSCVPKSKSCTIRCPLHLLLS